MVGFLGSEVILCDPTCVRSGHPFSGQKKLYNSASMENKKTNREDHSTFLTNQYFLSLIITLTFPSDSMSNAISPPDQTDAASNQSFPSLATTDYLDTRRSGPSRSQFQTIQDLDTSRKQWALGWASDRKISVMIGEPPTTTTPSTKSRVTQTTPSGTRLEPHPLDQDDEDDDITSVPLTSHQCGK